MKLKKKTGEKILPKLCPSCGGTIQPSTFNLAIGKCDKCGKTFGPYFQPAEKRADKQPK